MLRAFEVDQFAAPQARQEFMGRFDAVRRTIGALGLQGVDGEGPALIFGGGALAMSLLDSYVPGKKDFDLDIIVPDAMFSRLGHAGLIRKPARFHKDGFQGVIMPSESVPLRVDIISSSSPSELRTLVGDEPYTGEPNNSVTELGGLHVLWPSQVAWQKVTYLHNRVKDVAGVIKAHTVAAATEHPILNDDLWQDAVNLAVDRLSHDRFEIPVVRKMTRRGPAYPSWIRQLIDANFEHPAFADIAR